MEVCNFSWPRAFPADLTAYLIEGPSLPVISRGNEPRVCVWEGKLRKPNQLSFIVMPIPGLNLYIIDPLKIFGITILFDFKSSTFLFLPNFTV